METSLTKEEIVNASKNLYKKYGENILKQDVKFTIMLNKKTKYFSDREKDKIIDKIWCQIINIKIGL
jgi:hypothetical protein